MQTKLMNVVAAKMLPGSLALEVHQLGLFENPYQTFLQYPEGHESNRAATALLARLDRKRRN